MATYTRYLLSSFVTLFSAFALIVIPQLGSVNYTQTALVSLLLVGVRAAFKALGEWMVGGSADVAFPGSDVHTFTPPLG